MTTATMTMSNVVRMLRNVATRERYSTLAVTRSPVQDLWDPVAEAMNQSHLDED